MIRAFVDASVFFSACFSARGASRAILQECLRGKVGLVISHVVVEEVRRNLSTSSRNAATLLDVFQQFLNTLPFEWVQATEHQVHAAEKYTEPKDAAIVAAAQKAAVDYLVTLDRKHLVNQPEVAKRSGLKIVLPEVLLAEIRKAHEETAEQ